MRIFLRLATSLCIGILLLTLIYASTTTSTEFLLILIGVGALITLSIPEIRLNSIALFLLLFAFGLSLKSNKWYSKASNLNENNKDPARISIVSFFIGIYDAGFGPFSSSFSILYFLKSGFTF